MEHLTLARVVGSPVSCSGAAGFDSWLGSRLPRCHFVSFIQFKKIVVLYFKIANDHLFPHRSKLLMTSPHLSLVR